LPGQEEYLEEEIKPSSPSKKPLKKTAVSS